MIPIKYVCKAIFLRSLVRSQNVPLILSFVIFYFFYSINESLGGPRIWVRCHWITRSMKVLANGIYQIFFTALNDAVFLFDNVHLVDVLLYNTFHTTKLFLIPDWEDWSLYGNNRGDKNQLTHKIIQLWTRFI